MTFANRSSASNCSLVSSVNTCRCTTRTGLSGSHAAVSRRNGADKLRHDPLSNTGADLPISWIKLSVIGDVHNLVAPVIHQEQSRCPVTVVEIVKVAHCPAADGAFARKASSLQIARKLKPSVILEQMVSAISRV